MVTFCMNSTSHEPYEVTLTSCPVYGPLLSKDVLFWISLSSCVALIYLQIFVFRGCFKSISRISFLRFVLEGCAFHLLSPLWCFQSLGIYPVFLACFCNENLTRKNKCWMRVPPRKLFESTEAKHVTQTTFNPPNRERCRRVTGIDFNMKHHKSKSGLLQPNIILQSNTRNINAYG